MTKLSHHIWDAGPHSGPLQRTFGFSKMPLLSLFLSLSSVSLPSLALPSFPLPPLPSIPSCSLPREGTRRTQRKKTRLFRSWREREGFVSGFGLPCWGAEVGWDRDRIIDTPRFAVTVVGNRVPTPLFWNLLSHCLCFIDYSIFYYEGGETM